MRVLHFSDVHVIASFDGVPLHQWLGKRAIGGLNLLTRRRRHFVDAGKKLAALHRLERDEGIDLVICTGDYTGLGLAPEYAEARTAVEPLMHAPLGYVNVPGNHDLYVSDTLREGRFENSFGDTLASDLPEFQVDGPWPLARLAGEHVAVIAVNSARPNPLPWRSNGRVPDAQLTALADLLRHEKIRDRYVFVITHYAPRLANGGPDTRLHGMLNADEFLAVCAEIHRGVILCGHVHHPFHVRVAGVRPAIFCAGSATLAGRENVWVFDIDGTGQQATPGRWNGSAYVLDRNATVEA